jgi:hypothetical protein
VTPDGADEVLVVSVSGTTGWQGAGHELARSFGRVGVPVRIVSTNPPAQVRTFMATDFVQARAAREVASRALGERPAGAIVYCSMTAALLWPRPGAIWIDTLAAENRPGRHGIWQRWVERHRLSQTPLVLTMSDDSLAPMDPGERPPAVTVPVPVDPSGGPDGPRDVDVLAYAGDPIKRGLEVILAAWDRARRDGETLVVAGINRPPLPGVRFTGRLDPHDYRALVRRARVYVAAPRREDFGIAALEALADGCRLVTTPAPGPYPALRLARQLDSRLVTNDLTNALRLALDDPRPGYAARALELVRPFGRAAVDAAIAEHVVPRLLPAWAPR